MKLSLIDRDGDRIKGGDELWPWLMRHLSIPVAKLLNRWGFRPEAIVGVGFLLGGSGAVAFIFDKPVLGSLLCLLSWFLDFVDGDLSRKSGQESRLGAYLDSVNGKLFNVLVFGGITVGYWHMAKGVAWVWGFLLMSSVYMFTMLKIRADMLDPQTAVQRSGFKHTGEFVEKSAWKFFLGFFLSGPDFLQFYAIVCGLLGKVGWALKGSVIYSFFYVAFNLYHGIRRAANPLQKEALKTVLCHLLYHVRILDLYLAMLKRKKEVTILTYHHIKGDHDTGGSGVTISRFKDQIGKLKKYFHIVPFDELFGALGGEKPMGRNVLGLTFDDGYDDFYRFAYPELVRENLPAMVYLVSHAIEHQVPIWTDRLASIIELSDSRELHIKLNGSELCYNISTDAAKKAALSEIKTKLKRVSDQDRKEVLAQLDKTYERQLAGLEADTNMMNWDQIREMRAHRISFGAHSMTHPILTRLDETDAAAEIEGCKKLIEERLGVPVFDFCYPNGEKEDFNESIKAMVKHAGYRSAATTIFGRNGRNTDLFAIKRIYVRDEPLPVLLARICGVIQ